MFDRRLLIGLLKKKLFISYILCLFAYLPMAAVVRPPSQPGEDASLALTRPSRQRVSRDEVSF